MSQSVRFSAGTVCDTDVEAATDDTVLRSLDDRLITDVTRRLVVRFGEQMSSTEIEARVRDAFREFDDAPIRDFVAVFVERTVRCEVRARLRGVPEGASGA